MLLLAGQGREKGKCRRADSSGAPRTWSAPHGTSDRLTDPASLAGQVTAIKSFVDGMPDTDPGMRSLAARVHDRT